MGRAGREAQGVLSQGDLPEGRRGLQVYKTVGRVHPPCKAIDLNQSMLRILEQRLGGVRSRGRVAVWWLPGLLSEVGFPGLTVRFFVVLFLCGVFVFLVRGLELKALFLPGRPCATVLLCSRVQESSFPGTCGLWLRVQRESRVLIMERLKVPWACGWCPQDRRERLCPQET